MKFKRFVTPVIVLFILMAGLNYYYYKLTYNTLQKELFGKIEAIAESVKTILESRELQDAFFEQQNEEMQMTLHEVADKFELEQIETIDFLGNVTNSTNEAYIASLSQFDFKEKERELLILGKGIIVRELQRIDDVEFLTALAGVDFDGGTGIIVMDIDLGYLSALKEARKYFLFLNLASVILFILISILTLFLSQKLEETILQKNKQDKLAIIGKMTASVAHEIKNPLGIIKNSADLIKRKYAKDNKDDIFDYMTEEIDRLDLTVKDFLSYSGDIRIVPEKIDPAAQIKRLISQMEDVEFFNGGIGLITFDTLRFTQLLRNLILNAKIHGKGLVEIATVKRSDGSFIEVLDRGPGFPVLRESEVFEPFYTTSQSGTGLGLSVCKMIVDKHGGKISARNREGGGARIVIKLKEEKV